DRFLFKLTLGYADRAAELELLTANEKHQAIDDIKPITDPASVVEMMEFTREVTVSGAVALYIVDICQATRSDPSLQVGGSSRASQALRNAARVMAASQGRDDVLPDDVKKLVGPVLNHRLLLTPDAMLRDETVEGVIERILNRVKLPMAIGGDRSLVAKAKAEGNGAQAPASASVAG
ncbi:MAG: MoxR-like ATPase, partial [Glaciecola sp.]